MADIHIRKVGYAGWITLDRPGVLNALSHAMCLEIEAALERWQDDDTVRLVMIDAVGDRAFCAGGDLEEMYASGRAGDFEYGRRFWQDEYRLNAKIHNFSKPYVSFMHGYVMGGGVGVSAHGSHRIVCESTKVAMPECGIGLVPDVGGSLILGRAGALGLKNALTGRRMGPAEAIRIGFADSFVPVDRWERLKSDLSGSGDVRTIETTPLEEPGPNGSSEVDQIFDVEDHLDLAERLATETEFAADMAAQVGRQSPLSVAVAIRIIREAGRSQKIETALDLEYRFTSRVMEHGDFIEGIRAQIIDKDRSPEWRHASLADVRKAEVEAILAPLPEDKKLKL